MEGFYDLIVIGGGPAGYTGAQRSAKKGLKTLLIEKKSLGGVCLNEGCIPTKTLLHSAKIKESAENGKKYGVVSQGVSIDHKAVIARKNRIVKILVHGVGAALKTAGVEVLSAEARITGREGDAFAVMAGGEKYIAKRLLIAAGSKSIIPSIPGMEAGFENGYVLTSREMLDISEVPKELVVIGGGVIGLEMASYFNAAGSHVTVIEMLHEIGGHIENDIAEILKRNLSAKGIEFCLGCRVTAISESMVEYEDGQGIKGSVSADKVLLSIGRRPCCDGLGLDSIGVVTEAGAVVTDKHMMTNVGRIYAAGDIIGKSMLAHTAYREAEVAVAHMMGENDEMDYGCVPSVIYTYPEVACAGMTEKEAREACMEIVVKTLPMNFSGRYAAEIDRGDGIIKVIAAAKNGTLLGVHMISPYASELIYGVSMMIAKKTTLEDIRKTIFPHPTVGEALREAVFDIDIV